MLNINRNQLNSYIELSKPSILTLVLVTTFLGYYLGMGGHPNWLQAVPLLLGAAMVCAGSSALNHYLEREFDSKMMRTCRRPIPSGRIQAANALYFGIILIFTGLFILYVKTNILTAFLSLLTAFLYVLVYTPLKRVSWINTTIGAIPGAIPPLGGWATATGTLNFDAGILFLILFLWQHPHFFAIAWIYREDYARGGFKMLPCVEPDGNSTFRQIVLFSVLLIPVTLVPAITGLSGGFYYYGALASGIILLIIAYRLNMSRSLVDARRLLKATVFYLPLLLCLIMLDTTF